MKRANRGFTLMELLIVIAIIGILVAVAIPTFGNTTEKARKATCDANKQIVRRALVYALALDPCDTVTQQNKLVEVELSKLGAVQSGSTYSGLCPSGGKYTVGFSFITQTKTGGFSGERVFVACSCPKHGGEQWETGMTFAVGDTMTSHGYVFECIRAHTTGTTSRTRDPSLRSNKSTWQVVAFSGEPLPYSSTVRYAIGFQVKYNGGLYARKDFNLVGGQVPYEKKDSDYWIYLGPAE